VLAGTTNGLNYNRSAPAHPDAIPTETYVGGTKTVVVRGRVKLTRFRGHPNICVQGAHDGEDETTLHT
jgi:hypothetical protein